MGKWLIAVRVVVKGSLPLVSVTDSHLPVGVLFHARIQQFLANLHDKMTRTRHARRVWGTYEAHVRHM